jgi:hypothetical protein
MKKDPIVQQVRSVRKEIEEQYPDADSFYKHLEEQQKVYKSRLVRRAPKRSSHAQAG